MISDDMLRAAAAKSCEIYANKLECDYNANLEHEFSRTFEKKIKKLKHRANHPILYRSMQRVAVIFLVMMIAGGTWISVSAEARAAFFGWIKEIYETYFFYHFEGEADNTHHTDYRPTWVPDGYVETFCDDEEDTVFVVYSNAAGKMINFSYAASPSDTTWFIDRNNSIITQISINGNAAELFISTDSSNTNSVVWSTEDNAAFFISAFVEEEELIRMAESVSPIHK